MYLDVRDCLIDSSMLFSLLELVISNIILIAFVKGLADDNIHKDIIHRLGRLEEELYMKFALQLKKPNNQLKKELIVFLTKDFN